MSAVAITMMVFSIAVLWGGLALAIVHLSRATPVHEEGRDDIIRRVTQERDL